MIKEMIKGKDFSHFKYYVKRLKAMGFHEFGANDLEKYPCLSFIKEEEDRTLCVLIRDYSCFNKYDFPHFGFRVFNRNSSGWHKIYKIGFDKYFEDLIKQCYVAQRMEINEYPTWRKAFNELVIDVFRR